MLGEVESMTIFIYFFKYKKNTTTREYVFVYTKGNTVMMVCFPLFFSYIDCVLQIENKPNNLDIIGHTHQLLWLAKDSIVLPFTFFSNTFSNNGKVPPAF